MTLNVYSIKDVKVGNFSSTPFMLDNDNVALRAFSTAINNGGNSQISIYYEDMQLWRIGTFNDKTGEIKSEIEFIANGSDVKKFTKNEGDQENGV